MRHYQPHIPTALLIVGAGEYPELRLKAWTSRVLTAYLSVALQELCQRFTDANRPLQLALAAASCGKMSEWLLLVERYPRYLSEVEAQHLHTVAWEFLRFNYCIVGSLYYLEHVSTANDQIGF